MATTSTVPSSWYNGDQQQPQQQQQQQSTRKNSGSNSAGSSRRGSASTSASGCTASTSTTTTTCPPPVSSFPDKFQDFFAALKEDCDDLPTMLEDKLIPRKGDRSGLDHLNFAHNHNHHNNNSNSYNNDNNNSINNNLGKQQQQQRWSKRAFQRRSSEIEVRAHHRQQQQQQLSSASGTSAGGSGFDGGPRSPTPSRRRSSSIAVARPTPDLHRFLQAEGGRPWGHLSPQPRSPSRTPSSVSPASQHLSPAGPCSPACPSPTSPGGATTNNAAAASTSRLPPRQRGRTSSMPAVPRHRPMLADTRRGGIGPGQLATSGGVAGTSSGGQQQDDDTEDGVEYYRLRSFSITANGVFNLGDSLKSRRSRSINSVTSSGGTSCSSTTRDARLLSSTSQLSGIGTDRRDSNGEAASSSPPQQQQQQQQAVASYKVGMLGASGVGKTALTAQFTTSEYICAYDASLDDEYGQKSVSVMIDGQETELEIIDHPATEMSVEAFCSTYNPDVYVVVYSVVDRASLKYAEDALMYLWKSDYMAGHGVILVGNKVDLERKREVPAIN
ncbi:ubiquitin carboxyl-terminal hydrolase 36-like isoform X2 [Trichogramma pretiosum]|uniref:ubiquitin carboxyl-terminal hydrolase 36-like isoform X2 n=1 Tax=Trichogramma pretiosum TaxID=7493 RepID=UPI000C719618|nr:ubiquitin carboxyl-terminal hydrolase 36-like isoform X2 [Trichogramma pretiosum]